MKKIAIIGGGVAGLTAGIYAQLLGFESVVIEKNHIAGGELTGWDRQGFHIDNCIHWLCGTEKGSDINKAWRQVGALGDDVEIIKHDALTDYHVAGEHIVLWRDVDRAEREMKAIAPEDAEEIGKLLSDVRGISTMEMPIKVPVDMMSIGEILGMAKAMKKAGGVMNKSGKISCAEYAKRFKSKAMREFFTQCMPEGYSISTFIFSYGMFTTCQADVPAGGSRAMALRMVARYEKLGGKLMLNAPVEDIIIEGNTAIGVKLKNGDLVKADYTVAACDAKFTLDTLLHGKYPVKEFDMRYANETDYPTPTSVMVSFGVDVDLTGRTPISQFECEPFEINGKTYALAGFHHYAFEKGFAPEGKTVATSNVSLLNDDYRYFAKLYEDKPAYEVEKQRIANILKERIEREFPELAGKLTIIDVVTPVTYARYVNAHHGAWMSFMMTPTSKSMMHKGNIRGLKNCVITGQWTSPPGGLPTALSSGKGTIQRIAKAEHMNYRID